MSTGMHYHILTLFPEMVEHALGTSILGRAAGKGTISMEAVNIRDFTEDRHRKVDDYPYGGGAGMLMQAQPVYDAWKDVCRRIEERTGEKRNPRVIFLTPQGRTFSQRMAGELAREEDLIFLCGHYEGIDERVLTEIVTDEVSIGDYVLTGGELAAMVMIDAISRLVPGVLKNEESAEFESFHDNLLEYPQYTRPEVWNGMSVPPVLLSGDHKKVDQWRLALSEERTREKRPDLYEKYARKGKALAYLDRDRLGHMDMTEAIRRGQARILGGDENGVLIYEKASRSYMISASDPDMGERLLSLIPRESQELCFAVHQPFLRESIARRFGKIRVSECRQAVYTRKRPPEGKLPDNAVILPIGEEWLEQVYRVYHDHHTREYLLERIRSGALFGIFSKDSRKLWAFGGFHAEGSMGMLYVWEEYRRQGLGQALEAYLIRLLLEKRYTPFCQIFIENESSAALQKKLGLKLAPGRLFWIS